MSVVARGLGAVAVFVGVTIAIDAIFDVEMVSYARRRASSRSLAPGRSAARIE